ncbi:MAG TPA: hypothetical protein VK851_12515 [Anaerolineales bacterium]|nr:hypothetical protein [Anaerolineales bacterium]
MKITATVLSGLALLLSVAATIYLLQAPLYQGVETSCTEDGCETVESTKTLVEANGRWVVNLLITMTVISGAPLFALAFRRLTLQRWVTWASALILLTFSIAGALSIGLAFMPSALLLLVAGVLTLLIRKERNG